MLQLHEFQQHLRLPFILWGLNLRTHRIHDVLRPGSGEPGVCFAYEQKRATAAWVPATLEIVFHPLRNESTDLSNPEAKHGSMLRKQWKLHFSQSTQQLSRAGIVEKMIDTTWDQGRGRARMHCTLFNEHEIELQAFQHRRKEKCSWARARLFTAKQSTHIATLSVKLNTVKLTF